MVSFDTGCAALLYRRHRRIIDRVDVQLPYLNATPFKSAISTCVDCYQVK